MKIVNEVEFEKKLKAESRSLRKEEVMEILSRCCPDTQGDVLSPSIIQEGIRRLEDAALVASFRPDKVATEDLYQLAGLLNFVLGFRNYDRARAWYGLFGMIDPKDTAISEQHVEKRSGRR